MYTGSMPGTAVKGSKAVPRVRDSRRLRLRVRRGGGVAVVQENQQQGRLLLEGAEWIPGLHLWCCPC